MQLMFTACATISPPQPPSLELPKPVSDLRATRKGNRVLLTWSAPRVTTDRQTVRSLGSTRICRGIEAKLTLTTCGTPVGEAAPQPVIRTTVTPKQKVAGSYTDSLAGEIQGGDSRGFMTYAIEVLNAGGRGAGLSNQVRVSLARTLPPPRDFAARVTGRGVLLTWSGDALPASTGPLVHYVYRVNRSIEGSQQRVLVGEIPFGGEPSYLDSSIEWEKSYEYRAETVTVISPENEAPENQAEVQVEGEDTPEIKVFAHDVYPPAVPSGLQAVFSGPGQKMFVDLVWAPVTDNDLDGYNVYRHEPGAAPVKVNAEVVKSPAYRDVAVASGKNYLYSVSAVDVRGNESARSEESGEAVP